MIAPAHPASRDPRTVFEQHYLPEITARSFAHYCRLDPIAREEAIQDCVCQAWLNFRSATARGKRTLADGVAPSRRRSKRGRVTPGTLALFSNRAYDVGRRFTGSSSVDVMGERAQLNGRVRIVSLDDAPPQADGLDDCTLHEALTTRRMENRPDELAQQRLDWSAFRTSGLLSLKEQVALDLLAAGYRNGELARALAVSDPRACQIKDNLAAAIVGFFGPSILPAAAHAAA